MESIDTDYEPYLVQIELEGTRKDDGTIDKLYLNNQNGLQSDNHLKMGPETRILVQNERFKQSRQFLSADTAETKKKKKKSKSLFVVQ